MIIVAIIIVTNDVKIANALPLSLYTVTATFFHHNKAFRLSVTARAVSSSTLNDRAKNPIYHCHVCVVDNAIAAVVADRHCRREKESSILIQIER